MFPNTTPRTARTRRKEMKPRMDATMYIPAQYAREPDTTRPRDIDKIRNNPCLVKGTKCYIKKCC